MTSAAPPSSIYQPRETNATTTEPSLASARPSVATSVAAGQPSRFPTRISLGQRNGSPKPAHFLNSTDIGTTGISDSITIEPSKYTTETETRPEPTPAPEYTEAELACIKAWDHQYEGLPCTEAEKEQARRLGDKVKAGALAFTAVSIMTLAAAGVHQIYKYRRGSRDSGGLEAGSDDEEGPLLPKDKAD